MNSVTVIQQYGENRCGTGILALLLMKNFNVAVMRTHKHDGPSSPLGEKYLTPRHIQEIKKDRIHFPNGVSDEDIRYYQKEAMDLRVKFVISVKNPFSHALSYRRAQARDGVNLTSIAQLVDRWNHQNRKFLAFTRRRPKDSIEVVRHEDLIQDQLEVIRRIGERFDLSPLQEPEGITTAARFIYDKQEETPLDLDYYRNHEYLKEYTTTERALVETKADKNVLLELGYSPTGELLP